jgi:hypothetical protein
VHIAIDVSMMTIAVAIVSDERSHDRRFLIPLCSSGRQDAVWAHYQGVSGRVRTT